MQKKKISELENTATDTSQNETEKRELKQSTNELWDNFQAAYNTCNWIPQRRKERRKGIKKKLIFERSNDEKIF